MTLCALVLADLSMVSAIVIVVDYRENFEDAESRKYKKNGEIRDCVKEKGI